MARKGIWRCYGLVENLVCSARTIPRATREGL